MKILLIGEYSRLHNSLKEGLESYGHEVVLFGTRDGFKGYPVDENFKGVLFEKGFLNFITKVVYRLFKINFLSLEQGLKFYARLKKYGDFDVVQLINEMSIETTPKFEIYLLKKVFLKSKKTFLLSCGTDYISVSYANDKKFRYSILTPYFEGIAEKDKVYSAIFRYLSKSNKKIHAFLYQYIDGVIASDLDYHIPLIGNKKYLGLIPNPINTDILEFNKLVITDKIIIFHGVNIENYHKKGNYLFDKALDIIIEKYSDKVDVIRTENIPYVTYIEKYNTCHILLDQVYAFDQGYNALEAMAKGKVVFTGAEKEFLEYYHLENNQVCINALPSVDSLVDELEHLILNPSLIPKIGLSARKFIEENHSYKEIAKKYLAVWSSN
tara:strand:- start:6336 stop:7481 length:1146 start_codon:yes stop_codon:yes gene_type:complete